MAATSSNSTNNNNDDLFVDDFYFSALFDHEEIFPISDELYAEELQLQEALMSAAVLLFSSRVKREPTQIFEEENRHHDLKKKKKIEIGESSQTVQSFCEICRDSKPVQEMFTKTKCTHLYCFDCIASYVASKLQENVSKIKCPNMRCETVLEPQLCRQIIPKNVFSRWENVLSKSLIFGSQMVYCPHKDCAAVLVDDGGDQVVTESECPNCHRLFCGQCNAPWHAGMDCKECGFQFCYGCGTEWSTGHQCPQI
ncbi:hypothetical protein ACOSQ2_020209 [Xanthoceras sorbifolium]